MKFDMSKAWNEAMAMIGANREVLSIVAGIFFFLPSVLTTIIMPALPDSMASFETADMAALEAQFMAIYADYWWLLLLGLVAQLVGYLALLALLGDSSKPTVGSAIKSGFAALLPALGTYLLFVLGLSFVLGALVAAGAATGSAGAIVVVTLAALVLAIYLVIKFSLSAPVLAIERVRNPVAVLGRSWRLTKGNSLRLFVFFLLIVLVYLVLSIVLGIALMALGALAESITAIASAILSGVVSALVAVIFVAVLAAIHRQLAGPGDTAIRQTFE